MRIHPIHTLPIPPSERDLFAILDRYLPALPERSVLAHSGFRALNDYVGQKDLFGRALRMTKVNVMDALATSAVLVMGEGNESTPLALLDELPFVTFQAQPPSSDELKALRIALADDLYAPLLTKVDWQRGRG
jgi:dihydrofolate synthase / folylpolyglutamate synthase